MTHHGRHRKRHAIAPLLVAISTLGMLVGGVWGVNALQSMNDNPDQKSRTHLESMQAAVARATDDCRSANELFTQDIVAVQGAIQQWRIHIDAMTQLTSGKIDLNQAVAFWDSTRVEGKRTLALFHRVDGRYQAAKANCDTPAVVNGSGSASAADLKACQQRQDATDTVLRDARGTLADWKMHIKDMDALRTGELGPKHAIHMWHAMYQRGKAALAKYDADHKKLNHTPDCVI